MSFAASSAAWLFTLTIPLVVLYFLKLKRPRLEVPSLVLWHQALQDRRVNSPFQKFKRNLLLLLQLLLLWLLVAAAMQPFLTGETERAERLLVLVDRSASMAARERAGGVPRLDAAKARIGELVDGLGPEQEVSLIAFARTAQQVARFTSNKRVLRAALTGVAVEDVGSDLEEALHMASATLKSQPFDRVLLFSDGNFPPGVEFELPFRLDYQRLPRGGPNVGITDLRARRRQGAWEVFVAVRASPDFVVPVRLELWQDGAAAGQEEVTLPEDGRQRFVFTVAAAARTSLELRLVVDGFDALAADDRAWIELERPRPLRAWVAPKLESFRHALAAHEGVELSKPDDVTGAPDLAIADTAQTPVTGTTTLFVGVVPPELRDVVVRAGEADTVIDWQRHERLLEHVQLDELLLSESPRWAEGAGEEDVERLRFEVLAHGQKGPLLLTRQDGGRRSYHFLFHCDRSTLPYRVGFPILTANLVRIAMQQVGLLEVRGPVTGTLPDRTVGPGTRWDVAGPAGLRHEETADANGLLAGIPAPRVGLYDLRSGGRPPARVGVSLLDAAETRLDAVEQIDFAELRVAAAAQVHVERSLWSTLALLALLALAAEWWLFHRGPRGRRQR